LDGKQLLGDGEASGEAGVLLLQPGKLRAGRVGRFAPARHGEGVGAAVRVLLAPLAQVRGVQPFAAQERPDLLGIRAGCGGIDDA
jgi:hypothetical protein